MNTAGASPESQDAVRRAMTYWAERWNWESLTLFGVSLEQLRLVLGEWPTVASGTENEAECASIGALRELLYGASAVIPAKVPAVVGLSFEQAEALLSELLALAEQRGGVAHGRPANDT